MAVSHARRAAIRRLIASLFGLITTTVIGTLAVLAVYYPLRHAHFLVQWLLVFALMVGESAAIHLPSEVILPVGGWLVVRNHHLGFGGVVALSAIAGAGNTVGSALLYAAGGAGGRPLVKRFGRYFLIGQDDIDAVERRMRPHTVSALLISRLLPVVRTYSGFVAGLLNIRFRTFLVCTFIGSFVWSLTFVGLGAALGANWTAVRGPTEIAGGIVVVLLTALMVLATVIRLQNPQIEP